MGQFDTCLTLPGSASITAQHEPKDGTFTINGEAGYSAAVEIMLKRGPQIKEIVGSKAENWARTITTIYWLADGVTANLGDKLDGCTIVQKLDNNRYQVA